MKHFYFILGGNWRRDFDRSMTELEIGLERGVLETDVRELRRGTPVSVLTETFFMLPVVLRVNGLDVFGYKNTQTGEYHPRIELPVFSILLEWRQMIDRLPFEKKINVFLADAGQMLLSYESGLISIQTNFSDVKASEDFAEFSKSVGRSLMHVTEELKKIIPEAFEIDVLRGL